MIIRQFTGDYNWLSNFYPCNILYNGEKYHSVEAAFQAQKCVDADEKKLFTKIQTGAEAKKLGARIVMRSDWEQVKEQIMYELLLCKFRDNVDLKEKLLATGTAILIEGNWWKDKFWGVCPVGGEPGIDGLNKLGELLMKVRTEFESKS